MAMNLAKKYSDKVDERFYRDSQAMMGTNKDYDWTGVDTITVYQVDTVPMTDYTRTGANRYGSPSELGNTIKEYTIRKDRSFTFTIDKGNKLQTQMVMDAGKSLARQEREVIVPEVDTYIFAQQAAGAIDAGNFDTTAASSSTAYATFLKANEVLGNKNVPDTGRIAFCSYAFCNLLMLDPAFMKYSDKSQDMVIKGILGEVDGVKIVKVPKSRLPFGTSFLVVHPMATVACEQLKEYKTHENPPGISGWLVEGRQIYDAFVLEGKKDALYLGMCEGTLGTLTVTSEASTALTAITGDSLITADAGSYAGGGTLMYKAGSAAETVTYGMDVSGWTELPESGIVNSTTATKITVAVAYDGKAVGAGSADFVGKA